MLQGGYILNSYNNLTITAHTGCENTSDNSIESVIKAYECSADIFEADIRFDKNGTPILTHDEPVGGEMTLEDAFIKLAEYKNMRFNIDIKCTDNMKSIAALAKKHNVTDRIFYTGINDDFVAATKETPGIPYYLNCEIAPACEQDNEYISSLVNKVKSSGAIGINCNHSNVTKELVDAFHNAGLLVSVWTCNEKADMLRMLELRPDNITTRFPSVLKELI